MRHRRRGRSLRAIGRICKRAHHTIARWMGRVGESNCCVDFAPQQTVNERRKTASRYQPLGGASLVSGARWGGRRLRINECHMTVRVEDVYR